MSVSIRREGVELATGALRRDARRLLEALGRGSAELSVVLCDDSFIRALNAEWRGIDSPTDVLSFEMGDEILGDVVISVDTAKRQAAEQRHSLGQELRTLLIHGTLHLLGHDHLDEADAGRMRGEENRLLALWNRGRAGLVDRALATG